MYVDKGYYSFEEIDQKNPQFFKELGNGSYSDVKRKNAVNFCLKFSKLNCFIVKKNRGKHKLNRLLTTLLHISQRSVLM